jgi:hypothetical protein
MMNHIENARRLRPIIERAMQSIDGQDALDAVGLYPAWASGVGYTVGDKVRYGDVLYRCLTGHTAQDTWTPDVSPSLWAQVLAEDGKILPWKQPDSTNPYSKGDKVTHAGKTWVSDVDGNVWEPGVYGWTEIVK